MKYYIITKEEDFTLMKVPDNLEKKFLKEYEERILARGDNILDALQDFENNQSGDFSKLDVLSVKYKTNRSNE